VSPDARAKRLTLVACILGSAIVFIDQSVVNVALPALRRELHASLAGQQWVVEGYLIFLGSLVLVGGSLGDLLGRRRVFAVGVAAFGAASVLCAAAPSIPFLVAVRCVQGMAGALLVPSTLAIVTATFEGPERGAAIGSWTAWTSGAIAIGPPLGGLLVDAVSWRLIFAINVPVVLATLWLIRRAVPRLEGHAGHHVDLPGGVLCALGLGGPVFALIEQQSRGWSDPLVLTALVGGLATLALFGLYEARGTRDPMLPLELFGSRNFAVGNAATLAVYAGLGAATFFVAVFLQQVAGYDALEAGLALLPITLVMVALSRRWGALAERVGPRLLMGLGPIVAGAGFLLYLRLDERGDYLSQVLPAALVFGLGLSMTVAPLTATVLGAVGEARAGVASGVNNAVARVAGLLAIAAVGAVVAAQFDASLGNRGGGPGARSHALVVQAPRGSALRRAEQQASVSAFHAGMGVCALLVIAGGVLSLIGIENPRRRPREREPEPLLVSEHRGPAAVAALRSGILQGPCAPGSASTPASTSSSAPSPS
jgi:EmrB/QacA subfamily drug resistance transporter